LLALILLLMTAGSFLGLDRYLGSGDEDDDSESVAQLIEGDGDVRVKFNDQFQWQKGRLNQKLSYDDAIFSGENSSANVKIGESELKLDANTLVILRQDRAVKSLNLTRGMLSGLVAKNDQIRIETGNGEKIELSAVEPTKIVIERKGTKTALKVTSGNANIVKDGKTQTLTSRDEIEFVDKSPRKNDPLKFTQPTRSRYHSRQSVLPVEFAWEYTSKRAPLDNDEFILEFAQEPTFATVVMRENLLGQMKLSAPLPLPQTVFYRVKDGKGNFSNVRRLVLDRPEIPRILSPKPGDEFKTEPKDAAPVFITMAPPQPDARIQVQVSTDSSFAQPETDMEISVPQILQKFPNGNYFLRARSRFEQDALDSEWSAPVSFTVREMINPLDLKRIDLRSHIVIPNLDYAGSLYGAADAEVQRYLAAVDPFPQFFADAIFENHQLVAQRRDLDSIRTPISGAQFPATWINPGLTEILYRVESGEARKYPPKSHRLVIEMEAPKRLNAEPSGEARWSPILFARSYEGRLKPAGGTESTFFSKRPRAQMAVEPGTQYSYRVRALGHRGVPISGWSDEFSFRTPAPPPELISRPVVDITQLDKDRKPAQEQELKAESEKAAAVRLKGEDKPSIWQRIGWWLWSGTGYNYVNVRQTIADTADVEYENTKGPSAYVEAGYLSAARVGGVVSYKRTPGDVRVDNYPVNKRDFIWTTTSAEGLWVVPWHARVLNFPLLWTVRAGVQNHYFPFLYVESGNRLVQGTNQMLTGSLGFLTETVGSRMKYYWSMRYQQPISSSTEGGNTFTVTPTLAFDGSVGASYNLTERWKTGLFWYGQLHAYDFNYQSQTQSNSGKQSLFYSNMEMRIGIDF